MFKAAVCDDSKAASEDIEKLIKIYGAKYNREFKVTVFTDPLALLDIQTAYDIYFLDVEMPDLSGLELAKELTRRFNDPIIFFITNYEHYLDEAFDIHAFRYLYKPVEQERFFKSLDKAVESCEHCAEKHVLLDVYELNGTFLAINLTNSRETEPKQKNGRLVSDKADRQNHGIGMESVRRCIEKYRGDMEYFYDKDKKTFSVTVLMNLGR